MHSRRCERECSVGNFGFRRRKKVRSMWKFILIIEKKKKARSEVEEGRGKVQKAKFLKNWKNQLNKVINQSQNNSRGTFFTKKKYHNDSLIITYLENTSPFLSFSNFLRLLHFFFLLLLFSSIFLFFWISLNASRTRNDFRDKEWPDRTGPCYSSGCRFG